MTCLAAVCLAAGIFTVVDGDTLKMGDQRLRLWGIDAPEMSTPAGPPARDMLIALVAGRTLTCTVKDVDRYRRPVIQCVRPDGRDVACLLIFEGSAVEWLRYSRGHYAGCAHDFGRR